MCRAHPLTDPPQRRLRRHVSTHRIPEVVGAPQRSPSCSGHGSTYSPAHRRQADLMRPDQKIPCASDSKLPAPPVLMTQSRNPNESGAPSIPKQAHGACSLPGMNNNRTLYSLFIYILFIMGICGACDRDTSLPDTQDTMVPTQDAPQAIGTAKMEKDSTLVLILYANSNGATGQALFRYPPGHPRYASTLAHVGPIEPGQEVLVMPWPEAGDTTQE